MNRKIKKNVMTCCIYILLVIILIITLFPLFWGISASLRDNSELFQYVTPFSLNTFVPLKMTIESYIGLFTDYNFLQPILNTLYVTIMSIVLGCVVNSVAAFAFAMFDFKFKNVIFMLILLSFMIPFEAIALPLYQVADGFGMVDTHAGMIVPCIASGLVLFLFVQFFKDIPPSLLEAGRIDGANLAQVFFRIMIPLSKPIFITAGLMIFMDQWNSYLWPLLIARSKDIRTIQISLTAFQTEHATDWSSLYAASILSALIPLALFFPFQKYFVQGITSSGVKG